MSMERIFFMSCNLTNSKTSTFAACQNSLRHIWSINRTQDLTSFDRPYVTLN